MSVIWLKGLTPKDQMATFLVFRKIIIIIKKEMGDDRFSVTKPCL